MTHIKRYEQFVNESSDGRNWNSCIIMSIHFDRKRDDFLMIANDIDKMEKIEKHFENECRKVFEKVLKENGLMADSPVIQTKLINSFLFIYTDAHIHNGSNMNAARDLYNALSKTYNDVEYFENDGTPTIGVWYGGDYYVFDGKREWKKVEQRLWPSSRAM